MAEQVSNWETRFDTAGNLMFHKFSDRVEICSNLNTGNIRCFRDGNLVSDDKGDNLTINEYDTLLQNTENDARNLTYIKNIN